MISFEENKGKVLSNSMFLSFMHDCVQENNIDILNEIKDIKEFSDNKEESFVSLRLMDSEYGRFCYGSHWLAVAVAQGIGFMAKDMIIVARFESGKIFRNMDIISFPLLKVRYSWPEVLHSDSARAIIKKMAPQTEFSSADILVLGTRNLRKK